MPSREVRVAIIGDPSSLKRALQQSESGLSTFQSRMQTVGRRMRSVGSSMTRSLTLPLIGFGFLAARELQAAEKVMGQTRAVIESMGIEAQVSAQQIADMASEMHELSGLDDEGLQEMLNTLLTFRNVVPIIDEAGEAVHNMAAFFGDDLQTAATQVGRALNNPLRGMQALTRKGVEFTEEQRNAVEAMMAFGDTAGAQEIILQELADEFGGQAEALGETVGGRFNRLKNDLEEVGASILESLIPALEDLGEIIGGAADWFKDLTPEQQKWVAGLIAALFVIGPLISVLGGLATAIGFLASPIGLVILAIAALGVAIYLLVTNWDAVKGAFSSFVQLALSNIPGLRTAVQNIGTALSGVRRAADLAWKALTTIANVAMDAIQTAIQTLTGNLQSALGSAQSLLETLMNINSQNLAKAPLVPSTGISSGAAASETTQNSLTGQKFIPKRSRNAPVANRANSFDGMKQAFREALREEVQMVHVTNSQMAEVY